MSTETHGLNKKIHFITGGIVFLISYLVYFRTVAPTTSFWDCGEFIACSRILGVMHPPGAPLYLLIGRLLTMFPLFKDVGLRVNMFSVFISASTVYLTYLIIVQLIRRWRGEAHTWEDRLVLYFSAFFGAMAFAFTDSFWFNAVEAEVYAFSMFFTALVVWLALYWGEHSEEASSLLLILFVFYLFGLAAGVHLLNVLAFPFVALIAYFHHNQTVKRLLLLLLVQGGVPILLYILFFQFDPATMQSTQAMFAHQDKASAFLKWFGLIWATACLIWMYRKDPKVVKVWFIIPVLVAVAYSLYLVIYIRATLAPPINENNPSTLSAMNDYLARKQYGAESMLLTFLHRKADFWGYQVNLMFNRYFGWQFIGKGSVLDFRDRIVEIISFRGLYGLPFIVGLWGAVHHFYRDWKRALAVFVLFFVMGYAIIVYLNQPDPQPRERDYSYVGAFFAFALWIGTGMAGILEWIGDALKNKARLKPVVYGAVGVLLLVAVPINMLAFNFESHDRQGNYVASDYSHNILESCQENAIIFTNGDNDTFPLWYLQEVEGLRRDVRVVNLSLLNTPWYIKQLRDQEPKIPIRMTDDQIDELTYMIWEKRQVGIPIPEEVKQAKFEQYKETHQLKSADDLPSRATFTLAPTFPEGNPQAIRIQDLMIIRILDAVKWKRPVYFAVTVAPSNLIGLNSYLRMDGLAYRVVPYTMESEIDPELLADNLLNKFQYRSLDDPTVHLNQNIIKLLQNYRSAYIQLARHYITEGKIEDASRILDAMSRNMPVENVPYPYEQLAYTVADLYQRVGRGPEAMNHTDHVLDSGRLTPKERMLASAQLYIQNQEWDKAEAVIQEYIASNPNDPTGPSNLLHVYTLSKQYDKGIQILEEWLSTHPGDPNATRELERLKTLVESDS